VTLSDVLSEKRAGIMHHIRDEVAAEAKGFGINVIDVRLRRADLPPENSEAIYARMQSERQQQASQYRGEGAEAAQNVRANAERERTVILADANRDSQKLRGEGDALAIKIYADAYGQDKNFFAFYRSMEAYKASLNGQTTTFVLSPDSEFFRYFGGSPGSAGAKPGAAQAAGPQPAAPQSPAAQPIVPPAAPAPASH
jgi:membrane protease subunit HflC